MASPNAVNPNGFWAEYRALLRTQWGGLIGVLLALVAVIGVLTGKQMRVGGAVLFVGGLLVIVWAQVRVAKKLWTQRNEAREKQPANLVNVHADQLNFMQIYFGSSADPPEMGPKPQDDGGAE